MNRLWTKLIRRDALKSGETSSSYRMAKISRELAISIRQNVKDFLLITLGIFSASFGFKGFLLTNHFIDGGATGISLIISALTDTPLYILLILVNIPFIF